MGGKVILNACVSKIIKKQNNINSIEYISDDKKISLDVDIIISSMPIKDLFIAMGKENVDENIYNLATNLPYRDFMSVYLLVDKLKLENKTNIKTIGNIIPDNWMYIQDNSVNLGRVQIFNNWSPYLFKEKEDMAKKVLIGLEYFVTEGDELWEKDEKDICKLAEEEAIKIGIIEKNSVELSKRAKVKKAYPSYFGTYENIEEIKEYLNTINNLYCIGRNGQHKYNNMDHSMLTGLETAKNIINNKQDKKNIWNVNTEKEYHEIKNKE